jgi:hypothetical protein
MVIPGSMGTEKTFHESWFAGWPGRMRHFDQMTEDERFGSVNRRTGPGPSTAGSGIRDHFSNRRRMLRNNEYYRQVKFLAKATHYLREALPGTTSRIAMSAQKAGKAWDCPRRAGRHYRTPVFSMVFRHRCGSQVGRDLAASILSHPDADKDAPGRGAGGRVDLGAAAVRHCRNRCHAVTRIPGGEVGRPFVGSGEVGWPIRIPRVAEGGDSAIGRNPRDARVRVPGVGSEPRFDTVGESIAVGIEAQGPARKRNPQNGISDPRVVIVRLRPPVDNFHRQFIDQLRIGGGEIVGLMGIDGACAIAEAVELSGAIGEENQLPPVADGIAAFERFGRVGKREDFNIVIRAANSAAGRYGSGVQSGSRD